MFAFLSRRLRRWILLSIVVPLVGVLSHKAAERIERRAGRSTTVSKGLRHVGTFTGRGSRQGPTQTQGQIQPPRTR